MIAEDIIKKYGGKLTITSSGYNYELDDNVITAGSLESLVDRIDEINSDELTTELTVSFRDSSLVFKYNKIPCLVLNNISSSLADIIVNHLRDEDDDCIYHEIIGLAEELAEQDINLLVIENGNKYDVVISSDNCRNSFKGLLVSEVFILLDKFKEDFKVVF